jgi:hypothetical protein
MGLFLSMKSNVGNDPEIGDRGGRFQCLEKENGPEAGPFPFVFE